MEVARGGDRRWEGRVVRGALRMRGGFWPTKPGGIAGEKRKPLRDGEVSRRWLLGVSRIVPVTGLALPPCWRSAGWRGDHRARTLSATLDNVGTLYQNRGRMSTLKMRENARSSMPRTQPAPRERTAHQVGHSPSRPRSRLSPWCGNRGGFVLTPHLLLDTLPTDDPSFSAFAVLMPRGCYAETI